MKYIPRPQALRALRAYLAQATAGKVYTYKYQIDPIDPFAIQVRHAIQGGNWGTWGEFDSVESASFALETLRQAQASVGAL